ncbi:MAG: hypothetical protein JWN60_2404 [Acidobacteria bacterium]|jgi:hypothetical protein|nr:hypothetical protein [Acidobacteriota bacterium]
MKKNAKTIIFMLAAFLVLAGNVKADSSIFTPAAPFELNDFQENLFDSEPQNRYSLKITNRSKWDIHEVYVETSENTEDWGKEWLSGRVLKRDTFITITNLKPGEYDVRFIDEGNDECILRNIAINKNTSWAITTAWLEKCAGYR